MLTETKVRKYVGKAMGCVVKQDDISECKKHSNLCYELRINMTKKQQLHLEVIRWSLLNLSLNEYPSPKSILHWSISKAILCKNLETGRNVFRNRSKLQAERVNNGILGIDQVKINNEDWYVITDIYNYKI